MRKAHDRTVTGVKLVLEDGAELELSSELTKLFFHVLKGTSRGALKTMILPEELTSTVAADLLGVSRPTLMKWVRNGIIETHPVGTHNRFSSDDVLALARTRRDERAAAFASLRAWDEAIDAQG